MLVSGTVVAIAVSVAVVVGAVRAGRVTVGVVRVMSADVAIAEPSPPHDETASAAKRPALATPASFKAATYGRSVTNAEYLARGALSLAERDDRSGDR